MPESWQSRFGLSDAARVGVFSALALGINAPFLAIPNVETFSLALFLSGLFLGVIDGIAVALIAGLILVFFNPNGAQTLMPVAAAQLTGFTIISLAGGIFRPVILKSKSLRRDAILLLSTGLFLTLVYDVLTNFAMALMFGKFWEVMLGGLSFGLIHLVSNTVLFGLSSTIIHRIWKRIEFIMPPLAG